MSPPSLDQELLDAALALERFAAADPNRPGMVELPLDVARRMAALLRTGADVVGVSLAYATPAAAEGQGRLDLARDLHAQGASYDQVREIDEGR